MKSFIVAILLWAHSQSHDPLTAPILGPYSTAFNYPVDMAGKPETRPCCWGYADAAYIPVKFNDVPAGYRVRVTQIQGNYMAWARGVYSPGNHTGTSWGLTTNAPPASQHITVGADNCFVYLEYGLSNSEVNQPFSLQTSVGGLLPLDNTMNVVIAVYLNDQPIDVHQEVTGTYVFQYERIN